MTMKRDCMERLCLFSAYVMSNLMLYDNTWKWKMLLLRKSGKHPVCTVAK